MHRSCLLSLCLALAACGGDGVLPARDAIVTGAIPETVSVEQPSNLLLELPAEMGAVQQVREHPYANAYRQEISLRGGEHGENVVEVSVAAPAGGVGSLVVGRPSEGGVRSEIIARFHDIPMRIVTSPLGNAAGPFGLAIGKAADGTRCVFAWQWIDDLHAQNGGGSGIAAMLSSGATPASVRVRLCRKNATVDELANLVQQIRPVGGPAVDRVLASGARRPVAVAVGAPASSVLVADATRADTVPVGATLESALGGSPIPKAAPEAPKPAVAKAARPRRVRHAKAAEPAVAATETTVSPAPYANGPRYMAPLPGAAASQAPGVVNAAPAAGGGFNPQLPAVAYRGPQRGSYAPAY